MTEQLFGRAEEQRDIGAAFDGMSAQGYALAIVGDPVGFQNCVVPRTCSDDERQP